MKYKNLREVKERRELQQAVLEQRTPETKARHRSGAKKKPRHQWAVGAKELIAKAAEAKGGAGTGEGGGMDEDELAIAAKEDDALGMDDWVRNGNTNLLYGAEDEPSDEEQREEQYMMEEHEALWMERIKEARLNQEIAEAEEAQGVGVAHTDDFEERRRPDEAFPDDSSDDEVQTAAQRDRGGHHLKLEKDAAGLSFAASLTDGHPEIINSTRGYAFPSPSPLETMRIWR